MKREKLRHQKKNQQYAAACSSTSTDNDNNNCASTDTTSSSLRFPPPWKGKDVIELGTGLGLVSLASYLMGATTIATDGDEAVLHNTTSLG